jgi:hypothetical protein
MKCSRPWGTLVPGLRAGGTSDRITIAVAKIHAAIRAALEACDPAPISELGVGMLSDAPSKPKILICKI